jgi:hypothetical protein
LKHEKVVRMVEKRLGAKPQKGYNNKWYAIHDDQEISWYASPHWETGELEASLFHVRRCDDVSDPYTDYFAGYHLRNATQMLDSVCPKPSKYSVGALVRGKDNKRATRQGYAGLVGIIMQDGGNKYAKVKWNGVPIPKWGLMNYPERDLEVISSVA